MSCTDCDDPVPIEVEEASVFEIACRSPASSYHETIGSTERVLAQVEFDNAARAAHATQLAAKAASERYVAAIKRLSDLAVGSGEIVNAPEK